jgi:hypothetical protein
MKLLEGKVAIITGASREKELQKFLQSMEQMWPLHSSSVESFSARE